jgi:hypothetical protein
MSSYNSPIILVPKNIVCVLTSEQLTKNFGFHQIPLEENSRDITTFTSDKGSFRWKVAIWTECSS